MKQPFKTTLMAIAIAALLTALCCCQESLPDRCAREAKEYTSKKCPAPIDEYTVMDSLTFDKATLTLSYYYTMRGNADNKANIVRDKAHKALVDQVRNSTALKAYKDEGYRFGYIYHSAKNPKEVLYSTVITEKDYR